MISHWQSPVGELIIGSVGDSIFLCDWAHQRRRASNDRRCQKYLASPASVEHADLYQQGTSEAIARAIAQLEEYFAGTRKAFDLPLALAGTDFQRRVWAALLAIPYGSTASYAEIARLIDSPTSTRAVASAIASNPISIIIPCHRIIVSRTIPAQPSLIIGDTVADHLNAWDGAPTAQFTGRASTSLSGRTPISSLSDRDLTGYAGGLATKRSLLTLEATHSTLF